MQGEQPLKCRCWLTAATSIFGVKQMSASACCAARADSSAAYSAPDLLTRAFMSVQPWPATGKPKHAVLRTDLITSVPQFQTTFQT